MRINNIGFALVILVLSGISSPNNADDSAGSPLVGWDTILDPDNDCQIKSTITITVPKTLHDLNPIRKLNAPRLLKEVNGDFTASVRVTGDFAPTAGDFRAAGLVIWEDQNHFLRLERGAFVKNGELYCATPPLEHWRNGKAFRFLPTYRPVSDTFQGSTTWFKIQRKDDRIIGWISNDGNEWKQVLDKEDSFAEQVSVGLLAMSRSSEFKVEFDDFELVFH